MFYYTYNFISFWRKYGISMNYFFKMATIPLVSSVTFSEQGTFLENLLLHSKHFLRVATTSKHCLTQQLLFLSGYFFRAATFLERFVFMNSYFFSAVIFSELLLSKSKTSTDQLFLERRQFFRRATFLELTFWEN